MSKRSRRRASASLPLPPRGAAPTARSTDLVFKGTQLAPAAHSAVAPPMSRLGGGCGWSLEMIRKARDAQMRGLFADAVRMAAAFRTNDALFTAYQARVATQSAIRLLWRPADTRPGRTAARRAELAIRTPQHARESILGTLANHGIAIGYVVQSTADGPDGPTTRMTLTEWPLEHVRYNASQCTLETSTLANGTITITHGDGRWIVFRKFGITPWTQDACVLPGALLWAAHGGAISDWASASFSHGQPKVVGTLAAGVTLGNGTEGALSAEGQALLNMIAALVSGESGAGVAPAGADVKLLYNGSTAWQVFKELGMNREKAAMRIYLGTDAALGSQGGAPGVDISALFDVASSRIQGDLEALERGFREGMIEPWVRMHGVSEDNVPCLTYAMPDADGERRSAQESAAFDRMGTMIAVMKTAGFVVDQSTVDAIVQTLAITIPCKIDPDPKPAEPPANAGEPDPNATEPPANPVEPAPSVDKPPAAGDKPPAAPSKGGTARVTSWRALSELSRVSAADERDGDGDGKLDEDDAAAQDAALGIVDGDGDGKLNESEADDTPGIRRTRAGVAKALQRHEAKVAKLKEVQAKRDSVRAEIDGLSNVIERDESSENIPERGPLHDLESAADVAESAAMNAEADLFHLDEGTDEHTAKEKEAKSLRKEADKAQRDFDKMDAKVDKLYAKHEDLSSKHYDLSEDDGSTDLNDAIDAYSEERVSVADAASDNADRAEAKLSAYEDRVFGDKENVDLTPEQQAKHDALSAEMKDASDKKEKADARVKETNDLAYDSRKFDGAENSDSPGTYKKEDGSKPDARDVAQAIVTGPKGGRYYLASSGEKAYVA